MRVGRTRTATGHQPDIPNPGAVQRLLLGVMTNHSPIPYAGSHVGPRRRLTLALRPSWLIRAPAVHVSIDGATYVLPWGSAAFEVPADRPVHISAYQQISGTSSGVAAKVLPPQAPPELEYRAPHGPLASGRFGPPGTVRARGGGYVALVVVAVLAFILVCLLVVSSFAL